MSTKCRALNRMEQGMRKKKKQQQEQLELEEKYLRELKKLQVPLLTLDARWHQLFPDHLKTKKLKKLEKELNDLIKKQAKLNSDLKDYEKLKKTLMVNVLNNMTDGSELDSPIREKKQDANQKLLDELQEKTLKAEEEQREVPLLIKQTNEALLIESMRICYETLILNSQEIEKEEMWISAVRATMTEHILHKQEMEIRNEETYKYMYDLLGKRIIDMFDRDYDIWKGEQE